MKKIENLLHSDNSVSHMVTEGTNAHTRPPSGEGLRVLYVIWKVCDFIHKIKSLKALAVDFC